MSHAQDYLLEARQICWEIDAEKVEDMAAALVSLREREGRLFIVGLGGSAANASHAVNDFRKLCQIDAYAPTDNVAELTARANDEGWDTWLADYLEGVIGFKDALLVLSVGGGTADVSTPISTAVERLASTDVTILGIVGRKKGVTQKHARCLIVVPEVSKERVTPHTEAFQSVILHALVSHPLLQQKACKW